jgi:hypothetical protein
MDFYAVLDEVLDLLRRRGRVTYARAAACYPLEHMRSGVYDAA